MSATYIFRLDDITPGMDWGRFWALLQLFKKNSIKPLIGIVPDNRDPKLNRQKPRPDFWTIMRELADSNSVDIAQHGYQHILVHRPGAAILGPDVGIVKPASEFAGDTYSDQLFRIREGQRILARNGLKTSFWMAPNHSYDHNTLRALVECGFTALSDGTSLFPYSEDGLIFVPQTSWRPRWMPFGVQTVCLHTNTITPKEIKRLRRFIRQPFSFMSFSEVVNRSAANRIKDAANRAFSVAYRSSWMLRGLSQHRDKHAQ